MAKAPRLDGRGTVSLGERRVPKNPLWMLSSCEYSFKVTVESWKPREEQMTLEYDQK